MTVIMSKIKTKTPHIILPAVLQTYRPFSGCPFLSTGVISFRVRLNEIS